MWAVPKWLGLVVDRNMIEKLTKSLSKNNSGTSSGWGSHRTTPALKSRQPSLKRGTGSVRKLRDYILADINEENNVIRLHLRRTERELTQAEEKYFEVLMTHY